MNLKGQFAALALCAAGCGTAVPAAAETRFEFYWGVPFPPPVIIERHPRQHWRDVTPDVNCAITIEERTHGHRRGRYRHEDWSASRAESYSGIRMESAGEALTLATAVAALNPHAQVNAECVVITRHHNSPTFSFSCAARNDWDGARRMTWQIENQQNDGTPRFEFRHVPALCDQTNGWRGIGPSQVLPKWSLTRFGR